MKKDGNLYQVDQCLKEAKKKRIKIADAISCEGKYKCKECPYNFEGEYPVAHP